MVTANLDNVKLEAAVLDPDISARGFVLTCSSSVSGPGVELEIGVGDKMYEVRVSFFEPFGCVASNYGKYWYDDYTASTLAEMCI